MITQNGTTASSVLSACRRVGESDVKRDQYNLKGLSRKHRGKHSNILKFEREKERFCLAWVHFGRLGYLVTGALSLEFL